MIDGADLELFERSVRAATESRADDLDTALVELGWHDALSGDPCAAISTLFTCQGRANVTSSALDQVVRDALGITEHLAVVLPALGHADPPAELTADGRSHVRGLMTTTGASSALVVIGGDAMVTATVALGALARRDVLGLDPSLGLVEVRGEAPFTELGAADWTPARRHAQLAIGHELVGASRTMLDLARRHALDRIQFGRPIAAFQAVRHRLAETLVAVETADALLAAAWEDELPQTAAMAKALAGRSARTTARHCQQVLAGIGFTTEHDLHRYIRRVFVLDELFGASSRLTADLGRDLLVSRRLPPLLPL